jgi:hypothetical protein
MKTIASFIISILIIGCQHAPTRYPSSEYQLRPHAGLENLSSIANQHVLVVTHATTEFDQDKSAAAGIDQLVGEFKAKGRPVIYLVSDQSEQGYQRWYTTDRSPDYEIFSEGGEHNLPISANEVTIIGGFFGSTDTLNGCHALAVKDAIRMHFETSNAPLTVHIPIRATYFYQEWNSIRQTLLKDGRIDLNSFGIEKYPFASMFFLREGNDGAGDDGNEQNFAHYYTGDQNKKYRAGAEVSREKYQFRFYVNDQLIESVTGSGKRIVNLKMDTR